MAKDPSSSRSSDALAVPAGAGLGWSDSLQARAELALAVDPAERRPLLQRLLARALTDFDVPAARSYLDELESDAGLSSEQTARVRLHRGAMAVLSGKLVQAVPVFQSLCEQPATSLYIRAEAQRGLELVSFEQLSPQHEGESLAQNPALAPEYKPAFWRFIDVLMASDRGDAQALESLLASLETVEPRSTYLAAAHALGRAANIDRGWAGPDAQPGARTPARARASFESAITEARAAVLAAASAADGAPARLATACWIVGLLEGYGGSPARGVAALLEVERLLHVETYQALSARAERAWLLCELGETDAAANLAADVLERAEVRGAHLRSAMAHATLAEVARRRKHPGEAESRAARALDMLRSGHLRGILRRLSPALGGPAPSDPGAVPEVEPRPRRRLPGLEVPAPSDPRLGRVLARIRVLLAHAAAGDTSQASQLGAAALGRHCGLSREHLSRKLRAELGLSLRDLLLRERLALALPLLEAGEDTDRVAARIGLSDGRALRRALLRLTGQRVRDLRTPQK